jgi:hypothetical protein
VLQLSPAWLARRPARATVVCEQLAIIAVLMRETSAQAVLEGAAAIDNVQRAARGYLAQLLGLDADRITITRDGLAYADADAA